MKKRSSIIGRRALAERIAKKLGVNKELMNKGIDLFFRELLKEARQGKRVVITDFGSFCYKERKGRTQRIGDRTVHIPDRLVLTFKASPKTKIVEE